jgi:hypothetical protein
MYHKIHFFRRKIVWAMITYKKSYLSQTSQFRKMSQLRRLVVHLGLDHVCPCQSHQEQSFHVLEHDEQRETLKGYGNSRKSSDKFNLGVGSKTIIFDLADDLPAGIQDVTIKRQNLDNCC